MLEIESISLVEDSPSFWYEECSISFTANSCIASISRNQFRVQRFKNDHFFCIDLSGNFPTEHLTELLNHNFKDFLKHNNTNQDFEILLPLNTTTSCELFDALPCIIYLGKQNQRAYVRIQIAQDFEVNSIKWHKYNAFFLFTELIKLGERKKYKDISIEEGKDNLDDAVRIIFYFNLDMPMSESFFYSLNFLPNIEADLYRALNSPVWMQDYETDELKLSKEIIHPLLIKLYFHNVKYTHGKKEYGKDFLFSELNKFGEYIHYGMQVKAGDISGKANSEIDTIISQLEDAFSMPFYQLGNKNQQFISLFIITISGKFRENAKEKIANKIPQQFAGSVFFWDKEKILELIEKHWNK